MFRKDFSRIQNWFFEYINSFTSHDDNIRQNYVLKKDHSLRVCDNIKTIAGSLSFTSDKLPVAETTALLHDIGRFEQFRQFQTFLDAKSVNHAELGIEVINRYNVLEGIDAEEKTQILNAIAWHNRAYLPTGENEQCLLLAKLLRDADKLDIWKVVTEYFNTKSVIKNEAIEFSLPDTQGYSKQVYANLMADGIVKTADLHNLNDFKLLLVGWVFDLNFNVSLQLLQEKGYLESIKDKLPVNREINMLFTHVLNYINKRLDNKK